MAKLPITWDHSTRVAWDAIKIDKLSYEVACLHKAKQGDIIRLAQAVSMRTTMSVEQALTRFKDNLIYYGDMLYDVGDRE